MKTWPDKQHKQRINQFWSYQYGFKIPFGTPWDIYSKWKKGHKQDGEYCSQCKGFFTNHIPEDHVSWFHVGQIPEGKLKYCFGGIYSKKCDACI